jgi:hypothetical protein
MALNFPDSPSVNDEHTAAGRTWTWTGTAWVAAQPVSAGMAVIGLLAPDPATPGMLWWNSETGTLMIYYDDGDDAQWVDATPMIPGQDGAEPFESGSKIVAAQTTAPTGWTKDTTHNNKALRLVSGTVGTGGTNPFSSTFASRTPTGSTSSDSLSTAQLASHVHATITVLNPTSPFTTAAFKYDNGATPTSRDTGSAGSGSTHSHTLSASAMDFAVEYVDVVIITKD